MCKPENENNYRKIDGARRVARVSEALEKLERAAVTVLATRLRVEPRPESKGMVAANAGLGWFGLYVEDLLGLQRRSKKDGASGVDLRDDGFRVGESAQGQRKKKWFPLLYGVGRMKEKGARLRPEREVHGPRATAFKRGAKQRMEEN